MSRRTTTIQPKAKDPTPLDKKQHALKAEAEELQAKLQRTRQFLQKAPDMKAEAQRNEQQELLNRFRRAARIEGPTDFRLELVNVKPGAKPRVLRHERNFAPMMLTLVLLVGCVIVAYYVMQTLAAKG